MKTILIILAALVGLWVLYKIGVIILSMFYGILAIAVGLGTVYFVYRVFFKAKPSEFESRFASKFK